MLSIFNEIGIHKNVFNFIIKSSRTTTLLGVTKTARWNSVLQQGDELSSKLTYIDVIFLEPLMKVGEESLLLEGDGVGVWGWQGHGLQLRRVGNTDRWLGQPSRQRCWRWTSAVTWNRNFNWINLYYFLLQDEFKESLH